VCGFIIGKGDDGDEKERQGGEEKKKGESGVTSGPA
jgi:hypothetical protein